MMRFAFNFVYIIAFLSLAGCASAPPHFAVPEQYVGEAVVAGFEPGIRSWGDEAPNDLALVIEKRIARYKEINADYFKTHKKYPPMNYLALSGGSNNGAFAAGILCGWSASGLRPHFTFVTGVSTGALAAPFAFLGADYDSVLRREYTTVNSDNIFKGGVWTALRGVTGGVSMVDTTPLKTRLDEMITPELFAKIGAEHRKGRCLLIGTTNLEAQRGVIWNIGDIANSADPKKGLELFKKILLASAAVPGLFAPSFIDVVANGQTYQEIHVDGGVAAQVFLFPLKSSRLDKDAFAEAGIERNLYIIRNGKVSPDYLEMKPWTFSLSQRSIETLIKNQGLGDLYRLYAGTERDGINYRLAYIPSSFNEKSTEVFDPVYMTKLFDLGYNLGRQGDYWLDHPPGMEYVD